ncbi:MAG: tRNA epoxyqueuosine(34) reductase QueG [Elusimicrobia bacterium]|nr:tRNA epoxyqueuosine(34) reductase QueG [Elusimicrobiota bacterium]
MDRAALTRGLREEALRLGADTVGFAPAVLPEPGPDPAAYQAWVEKGMHGAMGYMARAAEERPYITRWFPPARSVIVCAFSTHDGKPPPPPDPARGRLARYARPADYHRPLKAKVKELLAWYKERVPGGRGKVFVDSSPVLERSYARYAGAGWVGKNSMLLSRKLGSFFLIAGAAIDAELDYDDPVPEHCGTCTRCLDACPTDAFAAPRVLDASRCIAYFTVELRGAPIPEAFREGHGDWLFGCDVCQDVCPWNRFAVRSRLLEPDLPPALDLEEVAALSPEAFAERFKGTSLERTGLQSVVRNALLAMGNSKDPRYRPALERHAAGDDPLLAEQARWSLGLIDSAR